ncbi:MAG: bifunctional phosphopantothenoylcysteine decarboxylase/phosphopantothenate--cysteine ligase CoaBC [Deltaproteobacteria bacterium]|nr:bifunctional phosphopantothenoylcysteine decarboxylase/phosphopantothenate--cysteine ligase CoaBC [Deltaproteobacteria bacterium]MBW2077111.1 bifunctional phosphopantothenoylcysteine decarboxylase/phosphopantothenate--cysteine ligase CoaBC [Deltaproteobacteria bacterium]
MEDLEGKRIIVGITGSIAAYKSAELVRLLIRRGAELRVVMTKHATHFISPLTFETLSGKSVITDMFSQPGITLDHVSLGQKSDLIAIAPATANTVGKIAHGIGDDFLSTLILAATCKVLVCPAMDKEMFQNPIVQANLESLKEQGIVVMEPDEGMLASGSVGTGRLPDPSTIAEEITCILSDRDLKGLKALITAGPTIEYIDPVRILTNRSTGKMGYALARAAQRRGAEVTLVSGPTYLEQPRGVTTIHVQTAEEMREAVVANFKDKDVVIKAAAVSDYRPRRKAAHKEKKPNVTTSMELEPTPDILAELGRGKGATLLVGFAAETTEHVARAVEKIKKKNLDLIVLNDVSKDDRGFAVNSNEVRILDRDGNEQQIPLMSKEAVADKILDRIKDLWGV